MLCMCINRGCVGTGESRVILSICIDGGCVCIRENNLCFLCLMTECVLVQWTVSYVLYVY